jgi:peptidoglycan biosynthesis protein MviN/MurJ (putative lipid II flippase)/peptidoglycan/xylan/chitin deacetylase (PgdA/CDA1 family)
MLRIASWSLIFMASAAVTAGLLTAADHFVIPAIDTLLGNVVFIAIIALWHRWGLYAAALAFVASSCITALAAIPLIVKRGLRIAPPIWLWRIPGLLRAVVPLMVVAVSTQANLLCDRFWGSHFDSGTITNLQYAFQLVNSGAALVGAAVTTVLIPRVARSHVADGGGASIRLVVRWLWPTAITGALLSVMIFICAEPLAVVVYQHGHLGSKSAWELGQFTSVYAFGVIPLTLSVIVWTMLITRGQMKGVLTSSACGLGTLLLFDAVAQSVAGPVGLALGAVIAGWVGLMVGIAELIGLARIVPAVRQSPRIVYIAIGSAVILAWALGECAISAAVKLHLALALQIVAGTLPSVVMGIVLAVLIGSFPVTRETFGWHAGVLMYHRVSDLRTHRRLPQLGIPPSRFSRQMSLLQKLGLKGTTLSDYMREGRTEAVALTFDDGYADNFEQAVPLLERSGHRATFFVVAGAIDDGSPFDWDMDSAGIDQRRMTWDQLRDLRARGHEIGSHSLTHPLDLRTLSDDQLDAEVRGSKRLLEERLQCEVTSFCYPAGHLDGRVTECVKRAGYRYACGVRQRESSIPLGGDVAIARTGIYRRDLLVHFQLKLSFGPRLTELRFGRTPTVIPDLPATMP